MSVFIQFESVAESIVKLFYPHVEVVIHDLKKNRIVKIYNSFSKRKIGDASLLQKNVDWSQESGKWSIYEKTNWNTRKVRSISSLLKNHEGDSIGIMCINFDVSILEDTMAVIQSYLGVNHEFDKPKPLFKNDWQERIHEYVAQYLNKEKISLKSLTAEHKKKLIIKMHKEGAFSAKNAAQYVAEVLDLSRATVYNYLK